MLQQSEFADNPPARDTVIPLCLEDNTYPCDTKTSRLIYYRFIAIGRGVDSVSTLVGTFFCRTAKIILYVYFLSVLYFSINLFYRCMSANTHVHINSMTLQNVYLAEYAFAYVSEIKLVS